MKLIIEKSFRFFMTCSNVFYCFDLPLQVVPKIITIFTRTTKYTKRGIMALVVRVLTDTVYIQKYSTCEFLYFFSEVEVDNCCSV